jgi:hypothetical protein
MSFEPADVSSLLREPGETSQLVGIKNMRLPICLT